MKKITVVLATFIMVAASASASAGRSAEQIYKECGPGGLLFGRSSPLLALISNVTWDLGTTAALSELSSPESCVKGDAQTALFINETQIQLEQDLAMGRGDHLDALVSLANCSDKESAVKGLRSEFQKMVGSDGYLGATQQEKSTQLYNAIVTQSGCNVG